MKKTLAFLLALVMVLGAFTFASAEVKTYKVGISIYQYTDNFMTLYRNEIEAYFKTLETEEVKYELYFADAKNDMPCLRLTCTSINLIPLPTGYGCVGARISSV